MKLQNSDIAGIGSSLYLFRMNAATPDGTPPWRISERNTPETGHVPPCLGEALRRVIIVRFGILLLLDSFSEKCVPGKIDREFQNTIAFPKNPGDV